MSKVFSVLSFQFSMSSLPYNRTQFEQSLCWSRHVTHGHPDEDVYRHPIEPFNFWQSQLNRYRNIRPDQNSIINQKPHYSQNICSYDKSCNFSIFFEQQDHFARKNLLSPHRYFDNRDGNLFQNFWRLRHDCCQAIVSVFTVR